MNFLTSDLAGVVALILAVLTYLITRQALKNRKLKKRLKIALRDCMAFCEIEQTFCQMLFEMHGVATFEMKRAVRTKLRLQHVNTPSELATPVQLERELERL